MFLRSLLIKYLSPNNHLRKLSDITKAAAIPAYRHLLPRLNREISRSRRFKHFMSVIAIGSNGLPALNGNIYPNDPKQLTQLDFFLCGTVLRDAVREIDITAYDGANNQFVLALPETTKEQALQTINRLRSKVGENLADHLLVGVAEFPTDGLIINDLLHVAMRSVVNHYPDDLAN